MLLTFGAILDKTAFLFRAQTGRDDVREALASAAQPLISDAAARPPWVNIFSRHDLFGGSLDYYDPVNGISGASASGVVPPAGPPIVNIRDHQAWIPLLAHDQYWANPALVNELVGAIGASIARPISTG